MTLREYLDLLEIGPRRFITDRKPVDPPTERPEMSQVFSAPDGTLWQYIDKWHLIQEINTR